MKKELEVTNRVAKEELKLITRKNPRLKKKKDPVKRSEIQFGKNKNNSIMKTALIIGSTGLIGSLLISFREP
jgi:hypothetical protein